MSAALEEDRVPSVLLAEGAFHPETAKTASAFLRYRPEHVVAVIDSTQAGKTAAECVGFGGEVPVVASVEDSLRFRPRRLIVGIAGPGGHLPAKWKPWLLAAMEGGMDVWAGLHDFLGDDPELAAAAKRLGRRLVDLRAVPADLDTPDGSRARVKAPVILAVGSDCNVGKMTATWEIRRRAAAEGIAYGFAPTGQTGVLLHDGRGLAIDRVIADFAAGAAERLVVEAAEGSELVLVEGQGSLLHPFFSGVTLSLLHGTMPDALLLCHVAGRTGMRHAESHRVPSLSRLREIYEEAASWMKPAKVIGLSLATFQLEEAAARDAIAAAREELDLPVEDCVRFGDGSLLGACERFKEEWR